MYLKKAIRGTIIVAIFTVLGSVFSYLFRILLARNMSVAEYGLFYSVFAFFSIFMMPVEFGLAQSVSKQVVDFNVEKKYVQIKSVIIYTLYYQIIISAILFAGFLIFANQISQFFQLADTKLFIFMAIWFVTLPIPFFMNYLFLGFQRPGLTYSIELFRQLAAVILTAVFLYLNKGVASPFYAYLCINFLMLLVYFPFITRVFPQFFKIKKKFEPAHMKSIFKYGFFITLSGVTGMAMSQFSTIILTYFKGNEAVGLYQTALPLANLVGYFSGAIIIVLYPMIAELYARKEFDNLNKGITLLFKYVFLISAPLAIFIFSFADLSIITLFGEKYLAAALTLKILAVSTLFSLLTGINNTILLATGFPKESAKVMLYSAIINTILNIILIPKIGVPGVAIALALTYLFSMSWSIIKIREKIKIDVPIKSWILTTIISVCSVLLILYLTQLINLSVIYSTLILILVSGTFYTVSLFLLRIIDVAEIKEFINLTLKK